MENEKLVIILNLLEKLYPEKKVFSLEAVSGKLESRIKNYIKSNNINSVEEFLNMYGYEKIAASAVHDLRSSVKFLPGNEPPEIKENIDSVLTRLAEYYPNKTIEKSIVNDHKKLSQHITGMYLWLGYDNASDFLRAYGYTYNINVKGGRPSTSKHNELLEYLKSKYKDNPLNNYDELKSLEPEYAQDLDKYGRMANRLFGMSLNKKLIELGILIDLKAKKAQEEEKIKEDKRKKMLELKAEIALEEEKIKQEKNKQVQFENTICALCDKNHNIKKIDYELEGMEQKVYNMIYGYYKTYHSFPKPRFYYSQLSSNDYEEALLTIKSLEDKGIIYKDIEKANKELFYKLFREKYATGYVVVEKHEPLEKELEKLYNIIYEYYEKYNDFPNTYVLISQLPSINYNKIIQDLETLEQMNLLYDATKNNLSKLLEELHKRYTNYGFKSKDIDSLRMENLDLPINKSNDWTMKLYNTLNEDFFYEQGLLKKNSKMRLEKPDIQKNDLELEKFNFKPEIYYVNELNLTKDEATNWKYNSDFFHRDTEINIEDYLGNDEHITIPATIDNKRVVLVKIKNPKVTTIEIPGSIKKVDLRLDSSNIRTLIIGEGIEDVNIQAKNTSIIKASKSVVKVNYLGSTKWYRNQDDLVIVGSTLCGYNLEHEVLKVPEGIKAIGNFTGNNLLKKVILPDSVTTINDYAFSGSGFSNLEEIVYTPSLINFGYDVFSKAFLEKSNTDLLIINNNLVLSNVKEKHLVIPEGIKKICSYAFESNKIIEKIELPSSLVEIDDYAFYKCSNLKSISIPDSVKKIGCCSFEQCEKLSDIKLSNSLEVIEGRTFKDCKKLTSVTGLNSLRKIEYSAFDNCSKLKTIQFNNSLKIISKEAFKNCESLEEIVLPEIVESRAFENCSGLKIVYLNDKMKIIANNTFENCINLKEVVFNTELKEIGSSAFSNCLELDNIKLPSTLEKIGSYAFSNCKKIDEMNITDSVEISESAFKNTPYEKKVFESSHFGDFIIIKGVLKKYLGKSKDVIIPDNVNIIGSESFKEHTKIETLIIPNSVKKIEGALFSYNDIDDYKDDKDYEKNKPKLKSLIMGNGIETVGPFAFLNCENLENVTFGNNLLSIESNAFYNCNSLRKLDLSNTKLKEIGDSAFENCTNINKLQLPNTIEIINDYAFANTNANIVNLPKSVKKIGKSSFFKTKELIVYDTIEPAGIMANEFQYDHLNGTINSSLAVALISPMEFGAECIGNTEWRNYYITVKSSITDKIRYRIFCDSEENDDYRVILFSGWGKNASFLFDEYDEFFKKTKDKENRIEMCFCRLMYPEGLSSEHKKNYENYFKRCMYIENSCKRNALIVALEDNVERLELLNKYQTIDDHNIKWIKDIFEENNATNCLKYLDKNLSHLGGDYHG